MTEEARDNLFNSLCKLSDQQVDPAVRERLTTFLGRPNAEVKDELLGLIDDIAYFSWTSSFEMKALHIIWLNIGGTEAELIIRNQGLADPANVKAWASKYKWQR